MPGRLSMFVRMGIAATTEPLYGRVETCAGANVVAPASGFGCEITANCPRDGFSTMMSSGSGQRCAHGKKPAAARKQTGLRRQRSQPPAIRSAEQRAARSTDLQIRAVPHASGPDVLPALEDADQIRCAWQYAQCHQA